jgi:hypothetical protein
MTADLSQPSSLPTNALPHVAASTLTIPTIPLPVTVTPTTAPAPTTTTTTTQQAVPVAGGQGQVFVGTAQVMATGSPATVTPQITFVVAGKNIVVSGQAAQVPAGQWTAVIPVAALAPTGWTSATMSMVATGPYEEQNAELTREAGTGNPVVTGPLYTSGNQILDASGTPVTLQGVVLNGLENGASPPQVTQQAVIEARAWGANFVRVPLGEQFWLWSNCNYSPAYQSTVHQVVDWITSLGMVALLDLDYNTVGGCLSGGPHNMADAAQSLPFWSGVASQYASNPLVAFDLYNEPHSISDQVWLNGGVTTDYFFPWQTYQAAGMQQLYDAVRSTGAQNLVFVSGNTWASTVPSTLVSGTNIVYAAHAYTCPNTAPPSCSNSAPYDPAQILDNWVGVSASVPVVVTEFGWPNQYDAAYNSNVITFAKSKGWGWAAFAFEDTQKSTIWDLTSSWYDNQTAEPSASGMPVLAALAGF